MAPRFHGPEPAALRTLAFLVQCAIVGLAAAFVLTQLFPGLGAGLRNPADPPSVAAAPTGGPLSYADAVARAAPSVVSIYVQSVVNERRLLVDPVTRRFTGITLGPALPRLAASQGAGVIVSGDGYILTNEHVVRGADEINVALSDGRVTSARIVGKDAETDLAVLKVEGSNLQALPLDGDAELRVGDVVLAIGNPFGLGQAVTQGIVSGLGRDLSDVSRTTYQDFIQTDAAINIGNSGGALIDASGELVGINTLRYLAGTPGGAEGISFAIPLSIAREVFRQIVEHGVVVRGWLGAEYGDAPVLPGALPPGAPRGVALTGVYSGGPADQAGLQAGDVLLELDGQDIIDQSDLRDREAAMAPGSKVRIAGLRAGVPFEMDLTLTQRPVRSS